MPYTNSIIISKLKKSQATHLPLKVAFLDVDGTLTGTPADQVAVRTLLEQQGYATVFVTHRSSELCMSHTPGTATAEFQGLLDPDIIAGKLGNEIVVRQKNGQYCVDEAHTKPVGTIPSDWPPHKQAAVDHIFGILCSQLSVDPKKFLVLIAGDDLPDMPMGLLAAPGSQATFIIPGAALLREVLFSEPYQSQYPLTPEKNGSYHFLPTNRTVIVGDEAFPGTTGPTTLQVWLKTPPVL